MALSPEEFAKLKAKLGGTTTPTQTQEPGYLSRVASEIGSGVKESVQAVMKGGEKLSALPTNDFSMGALKDKLKTMASTGIQTAGPIASAIFSPLTQAVKPALEATGLDKPVGQAVSAIAETSPVQSAIEYYKTLDPETQKNLEGMFNVASATLGGKGISATTTAVPGVLGNTGKGIKTVATTIGKETKPLLSKVAPTSEGIMQRVARIPKSKQQLFEKTSGESVGSYLDKRGIYGNEEKILTQLGDRFVTHRNLADTEIAKLPGKFQATPIKTALEQLIERETKVSSPGVLSPDFKKVQGLLSRYNKEGLSMTEINDVKRLFERNVKLEFKKSLSSSPESIAKSTNLDNALRSWQFAKAEKLGLKNLGEINKETRLARQLLDDLGKEVSGLGGNNALGLTDAILVSGGDPAAIAMLITKKGFGSKTVQSKIAEILSKNKEKLGTVTPKIGAPKKGLEDFMNATPSTQQAGQVSRLPSPNSTTFSQEVQRIINMSK